MSVSRSWLAAKGISTRKLLEELGLSLSGMSWELDTQEAGITAARLDSGWFIIYFRNHPYQVSDEEILAEASSHAELIVSCFVEEHTMYSQAWGFSGGEQLWTLWHDPSEGREHLEVDGTPPECLPAILRANLEKLQAYHRQNSFDVDTVFSVPIEVCEALSGFSYNMIPELIDPCLTLFPTRRKS
ncbi:hypothetical protein [Myxococcus faecalis]|uniref:hypothetical protein n=1 Tax=Myxococcus faecalis TaxID=3115646 RepID=UPI003CF2CEE7